MSKSKKSKASNTARRAQLIENKYRRKIYGIVAVVTIFMMLIIAALFHQYRIVKKYEHAVALVESGQYAAAMDEFKALDKFKDSREKVKEAAMLLGKETLEKIDDDNILQYADDISLAAKNINHYIDDEDVKLIDFYYSVVTLCSIDDGVSHNISSIFELINAVPEKAHLDIIESNSTYRKIKELEGLWELEVITDKARDDKQITLDSLRYYSFSDGQLEEIIKRDDKDDITYHWPLWYNDGILTVSSPASAQTPEGHYNGELVFYNEDGRECMDRYAYVENDGKVSVNWIYKYVKVE